MTEQATLTHRDVPLERAEGLALLGALEGSGYRTPPALVRRADGQTLQLTPLLYAVLEAVDGTRTPAQVAEEVTRRTGRTVSAENVWELVQRQLRPMGLLRLADGSQPQLRRSNPLLGLRFRWMVTDPEVTRRVTAPFAALFAPVVVVALTAAFLAVSAWVLFDQGLAAATHQAFNRPGMLLLVFVITLLSAGFHEFGHAAACRYGGATPGAMGAALYLVWPAFYTDVTDSYRLSRAGRLRVDLGGLYFNAIVAVAMFGWWWATRFDAVLLVIATQILQMVRQLTPLVRFDGYHVLADLTGVPDLYAHLGAILRGLLPGRWHDARASRLKPWVRGVVSAWVLVVVPLLLASFALMVLAFPRVAATAWEGMQHQWSLLQGQLHDGDGVGVTLRILGLLALALPVAATAYLIVRVTRRTAQRTWRATEGKPGQRATAVVTAVALVAAVGWAWWPREDRYQPVRPLERGTVLDAIGLSRPALLTEGRTVETTSLWAGDTAPPTREHRQLAVVLVPHDPDQPTWVFPFDRPDAPLPGDNQALAVNTTDGAAVYDVAFALVWARDGSVLNTNEAYAFASCRRCTTVAIAFQVVLVVGQADVTVPQNLAGALNYRCLSCVTRALAQQLVVTVPRELSPAAAAELERLWARIMRFSRQVRGLPLDRIRARLARYERAILDIVRRDVAAGAAPSATAGTATAAAATGPVPSTSTAPVSGQPSSAGPSPEATATSPTPTSTPPPSDSTSGTATATASPGTP